MGQTGFGRQLTAAWVATSLWLAGCASMVPLPQRDAVGSIEQASLTLDEQTFEVTWYWPVAEPRALLVMQHGFSRRCHHLRETTRQLMATPMAALCIDAPMAGGHAALAEALARRLAEGLPAAQGRAVPHAVIVGGHSAGAAFAVHLGARLAQLAPQRVAGAVLFDPVATRHWAADLQRLVDGGRRPMLAVLAPPQGCNAQGSARPALEQLRAMAQAAGRDTVTLVEGGADATHADAEGDDSDTLARLACGPPQPGPVAKLRATARRWLDALVLPPP